MRQLNREGGSRAARGYDGEAARRKASRKQQFVRRRRNTGALIVGGLLVLVGIFGLLGGGDEIRRGVQIGAVDVGGMTKEEASAAVEERVSGAFEEIRFGDGVFSMPGERLGVHVDAASAVDEAYAVGREGNFFGRAGDVLRSRFGGVRIEPEVRYEEKTAKGAIGELAGRFYEEPRNASFSVTEDGKIEVEEAQEGRVLDKEGTLANLEGALANMSNKVPLAEGEPPKPEVTTAEIEKYRPQGVIGEYRTDFLWDSNPNRKANMRLAAGAVNGTVLAPGETFSFNELAAPLDYKEAKTFSDGGVGFANGGGLCQVSSTLYMAANYAGLEEAERHPHYAVLPYIKPGFDATVWFGDEYGNGAQDMRFKNTTGGHVVIREWVDEDGFLNAQILGRSTGKKVEMKTVKIFEDTTRGIRWDTYKKVTKDGEVLFDDLWHTFTYSYNPPVPEGMPHYDTSAPRVSGWADPGNTTGWAEVPE